ncbi:hypothetical protein H2O64_16535 [Kordia sp. YSTF-M3]|uniref:Tyrosine specific protein phosphatases domain-containing protein n=1 Tax=Kordia aestuariivivens TaxID=2759037 RepID=A0ABR7QCR5_9FLAO|nr:hypothetical protein [Kordia aestuariivivens]MBC8756283.1 hypothetical protein [Kordia aestuariivivens]
MSDSFCQELKEIAKKVIGVHHPKPPTFCSVFPIWKLPTGFSSTDKMTAIFPIPNLLPKAPQFILVGIGYNLTAKILQDNNIAGVLNVAYDVDDCRSLAGQFPKPHSNYYHTQLSKVGLVDGNENKMMTLVAAIYMAEQLLSFPSEEQQKEDGMTNFFPQGNLYIHCHDGGSRSVTITALYIYYKFYVGKYTFQQVYEQVICARFSEATNHVPTQGICENAYEVLTTFKELFPTPVYNS